MSALAPAHARVNRRAAGQASRDCLLASAAAASAIGGIEVQTALQPGRLLCTAQVSDFAPGDLVVVRVDSALYRATAA
jgi:hypothetical protein